MQNPRIRLAFDRAAETYDAASTIQQDTLATLAGRIPVAVVAEDAAGQPPPHVLDIGCGTGLALPVLARRLPRARLVGIDFSLAMLRQTAARCRDTGLANARVVAADATRLPFAAASMDLVFSNLTWQWCDLPAALREAHRVLRPGGRLVFATLLEGTFRELESAFAGIDRHPHTLQLLAAERVLAVLRSSGFGEIDACRNTRIARYPDLKSLLRSIRASGAGEVSGAPDARRRGLLGRRAWQSIEARYATFAGTDGQLPLTYELFEVTAHRNLA